MEDGDLAGAESRLREALCLAPNAAEIHANLGLLLEREGNAQEAETRYRRSIMLDPTHPETHLNLGALLANAKRFDEAEHAYNTALALKPDFARGWSNLGALYACTKREMEAEQCYRHAISLDPSYATARFNLSYVLLRQGRFEEGWECLEARNWYAALAKRMACPRWLGEPLTGKSLLVCPEAGHGDVIQFSRYVNELKARGAASITLLCHPALKDLLATLEGAERIVALDEEFTADGQDFWTPLLSIPHYCNTRLESIPAQIPYLQATPERIGKWAPLLPDARPRVGLVWKGSTHFENDADRSLPSLNMLAPLATANASFVALQKGAGEHEADRPPTGMRIVNLGPQLQDFADTAAVLAQLDLLIGVDTAVAHLAGALGRPCWVLLPDYKTDWRWLTERADSPWYPTMRLFRQPETGGWPPLIAALAAALQQWATDFE